jgi:hypothetical protein
MTTFRTSRAIPPMRTNPLDTIRCLACGGQVAYVLQRAASLRCHECRDASVTLRAALVAAAASRG